MKPNYENYRRSVEINDETFYRTMHERNERGDLMENIDDLMEESRFWLYVVAWQNYVSNTPPPHHD